MHLDGDRFVFPDVRLEVHDRDGTVRTVDLVLFLDGRLCSRTSASRSLRAMTHVHSIDADAGSRRSPRSNQRLHDAQHERARACHAPARDDCDGRFHIESLRHIYSAMDESQRAAQGATCAIRHGSSSVTTCRDSTQWGVPARGTLAEHRPRIR